MFPTQSPYSEENRKQIVAILNQRIANLFDLYTQAKNCHWNCKGKQFYQQHLLFDRISDELFDVIDPLAERLVSLGGIVEGTLFQAAQNSTLPPQAPMTSVDDFTKDLRNKVAIEYLNVKSDTTNLLKLGDNATSNKLSEIEFMLSIHLFLLESGISEQ